MPALINVFHFHPATKNAPRSQHAPIKFYSFVSCSNKFLSFTSCSNAPCSHPALMPQCSHLASIHCHLSHPAPINVFHSHTHYNKCPSIPSCMFNDPPPIPILLQCSHPVPINVSFPAPNTIQICSSFTTILCFTCSIIRY